MNEWTNKYIWGFLLILPQACSSRSSQLIRQHKCAYLKPGLLTAPMSQPGQNPMQSTQKAQWSPHNLKSKRKQSTVRCSVSQRCPFCIQASVENPSLHLQDPIKISIFPPGQGQQREKGNDSDPAWPWPIPFSGILILHIVLLPGEILCLHYCCNEFQNWELGVH